MRLKKSELQRQQKQLQHTSRDVSRTQLKAAISVDLGLVSDAYDTGAIALTELEKLISLTGTSPESIARLPRLIAAYRDLTTSLIALRAEGRETIRDAVASQGTEAGAVTPPVGLDARGGEVTTDPDKISLPKPAGPNTFPDIESDDPTDK